jgi:hypothetical protein
MSTLSSEKAFNAYLLQESKAYKNSSLLLTILMPFPPPPETALIRTGYSILLAY